MRPPIERFEPESGLERPIRSAHAISSTDRRHPHDRTRSPSSVTSMPNAYPRHAPEWAAIERRDVTTSEGVEIQASEAPHAFARRTSWHLSTKARTNSAPMSNVRAANETARSKRSRDGSASAHARPIARPTSNSASASLATSRDCACCATRSRARLSSMPIDTLVDSDRPAVGRTNDGSSSRGGGSFGASPSARHQLVSSARDPRGSTTVVIGLAPGDARPTRAVRGADQSSDQRIPHVVEHPSHLLRVLFRPTIACGRQISA